jgi:hypothetical protein
MTTTHVPVTVGYDNRRSTITFHKPGCAHLRSLEDVQPSTDYPVTELQALEAEAKSLGQPSIIGPCLRSEVTA